MFFIYLYVPSNDIFFVFILWRQIKPTYLPTFSLANCTYSFYRKPNDDLLYIHNSLNHPRQIIKHLLDSIKERLSNNSSNEQVLNSTKPEYEKTLKDSGYKNENLKYRVLKEQRKKND